MICVTHGEQLIPVSWMKGSNGKVFDVAYACQSCIRESLASGKPIKIASGPLEKVPSCVLKLVINPTEDGGLEYTISYTAEDEHETKTVSTLDAAFKELREAADLVVANKLAEWMKEQPA